MSDRIQNIQRATETSLSARATRRGFLRLASIGAGLVIASDSRIQRIGTALAAGCTPQATDGNAPDCVTAGSDVFGKSYFGGFYFDDKDGDGQFTTGKDEAVQGVKDRRILVEEIRFAGSGDYVQLNPNSRTVNGTEVSYQDVKEGKNSGIRFVDRWTIFQVAADGGDSLGVDLRTGSKRLEISAGSGDLVDKVWAPVDDGKRADKDHKCSGNCQWNCLKFIQVSRLKSSAQVDLGGVVSNDAIHRGLQTGVPSAITDYMWLWETPELSDKHIDYSAINTPLSDALRESEKVVKSHVSIPAKLAPYNNFAR